MSSARKAPVSVFLAASVVIFFLSLSAADSVGFVPYYIDGEAPSHSNSMALSDLPQLGSATSQTHSEGAPQGTLPDRLKIDAINLDLPVQNPDTTDLDTLDNLLKQGPA